MVVAKEGIVWFTRGPSFGHATRDVAVISELSRESPKVPLSVFSYGRGLECLRIHGIRVHDLGWSFSWLHRMAAEELLVWLTKSVDLFRSAIRDCSPRLIVSSEEFTVSL